MCELLNLSIQSKISLTTTSHSTSSILYLRKYSELMIKPGEKNLPTLTREKLWWRLHFLNEKFHYLMLDPNCTIILKLKSNLKIP